MKSFLIVTAVIIIYFMIGLLYYAWQDYFNPNFTLWETISSPWLWYAVLFWPIPAFFGQPIFN
ncbi:MAG: hypothetical protein UU56_C0030G0006 [Candidatus Curtissbacteria bacterium GW2011_GWA2_41_24]|uniref:Uncharacterized protein n=1 Tax=Candidatus Curtissbacteria bacterium GW2011_GWA2_41_24 TaxID=1618411 RepID=A0A0G0YQP8_9BACT|nr:MAG: hypothetical protein UU56_C0030G0006 [Candidatus Curtissbacteria bacterium GW2011_GWA2_41_24]